MLYAGDLGSEYIKVLNNVGYLSFITLLHGIFGGMIQHSKE